MKQHSHNDTRHRHLSLAQVVQELDLADFEALEIQTWQIRVDVLLGITGDLSILAEVHQHGLNLE